MKAELINVEEFQLRVWGRNGTPPTKQAIRNMIRREEVPVAWDFVLAREKKGGAQVYGLLT